MRLTTAVCVLGKDRLSPAALTYRLVDLPHLGEAHLSLGHESSAGTSSAISPPACIFSAQRHRIIFSSSSVPFLHTCAQHNSSQAPASTSFSPQGCPSVACLRTDRSLIFKTGEHAQSMPGSLGGEACVAWVVCTVCVV